MTMPHIDIDLIFSDPLLLSGILFVLFGVCLALYSAVKLFQTPKVEQDFILPPEPDEDLHAPELSPMIQTNPSIEVPVRERIPDPEPLEESPPEPEPAPVQQPEQRPARRAVSSDATMIMAPGVSDLQAELEIAISQIKQLNKRVNELERQVEDNQTVQEAKLDPSELKELPTDPADYYKKLIKVVEHVIVLEKEVARLRTKGTDKPAESRPAASVPPPSTQPGGSKPPVMPL